ncbi:MAG: bifunctional [glutamine synthetase] adenylyltransferase/[glutamine synthetase]-adenylyl-L-tyrosine phosphorylase, partial [Methyloligellaceae bacterium]
RAALIKARVIAGDAAAGEVFLEQLAPFIWRRYLDFAAVADIHAMKRRVHEFKGHGRIAVTGHDIKLGRGGIREIEFFTQTQQLILGGRQANLRTPQTLVTLEKLARKGWIETQDAEELTEAYRFLRKLEHRLQMIADEQTHKLPVDPNDLERIACFCGFGDAEAFSDELVARLTTVQKHYDGLFASLPDLQSKDQAPEFRGDDESRETLTALKESGFDDPETVSEIIRGWRSGRYAATRSQRSRECLAVILPELLEAIVATADPGAAFTSFDRFLQELPAGVQLFSLLRSTPNLLRLIADIMGTAPRLARVLSRRSQIIDAVLDPGFFGDLPSREALEALISQELATAQDYQDCLERARRTGQEQAFLIGVRILSGTIGADQAGGAYARLARSLIAALHEQVEQELIRSHGCIKGGEAVVIAMGKLGGREMTAASDLDLIIVYDFGEDAAASDGARPLAGGQYYARFTQRLISALSAQTAQGTLYEVDMRLRPSGHAGPVATHFNGFVDYQNNRAWTWEHLALTRARIVSGPEALRRKVEKAIRDVLSRKRDREKIAADVHDMRARIDKQKGTDDPWDLKQVRGGLVDLEFIAQFLQIITAHENPQVLDQNTARSLESLAAAGVLTPGDAQLLVPAAGLYHDLTQVLRLCLERPFDPETASPGLKGLLAGAADMPDFEALEDHLKASVAAVRQLYERIVC